MLRSIVLILSIYQIGYQNGFTQSTPAFEMSYFEDVNSEYNFESVKKETFQPAPENIVSLGIKESTLWVRVKLNTELLESETVLEVPRPFLDEITLSYNTLENSQVKEILGIMYLYSKNKFNHFLPVFDLPIDQLASPIIYLKVKSRWSMLIPLEIKSKEEFYKERVNTYLIAGLLIGGLLLMALYNFFLFFSTRDFSYVLYVLALLSAILSQGYIFGILIPYLSPELPEFSFRFPVIIMASTAIFSVWFTIRFLEVKKLSKLLYFVLLVTIMFPISNIALEFLHFDYISRKLNIVQIIVVCFTILVTAIYSLIKGNKIAVYFVIAWVAYLSGIVVFALKTAGVLPHNAFTSHFMHIGTFLEVILLSFALGHKYYLVRIEKERLENQTKEELMKLVNQQTIELETSLEEKEVLLKEIHHRVKNNLQIVISLLDLQVASAKDEKNKEVLNQSKARVYSMSLIHQKLYQSNNMARVNMKTYLEELFDYLKGSYNISITKKIEPFLNVENKELSLTQAVPLGLIANELLTNSFKHGLQEKKLNEIHLSLEFHSEDILLTVGDSGPGFDHQSNAIEVKKSLGLFLIKSLTKQLRGTIVRYHRDGLFVTALTFPKENK